MTRNGQRLLMLIDEEPAQRRLVAAIAARRGWRAEFAADGELAIAILGTQDGMQLDAILLDHWAPEADATALIGEIRARRPALPLLMLTANGSVAQAVSAMRAGATDFLVKPLAAERLLSALEAAIAGMAAGELRPLPEKIPALLAFEEVEAGRIREDLYGRSNVVQVTIPPLRERSGDIPALARHLLARIAQQPGLSQLGITDDALALLGKYAWPGNVRLLQNALFRAAVLCEGSALTSADFPQIAARGAQRHSVPGPAPMATSGGVTLFHADGNLRALEEIEADVIRLAIGHYRGRMTEVARRLGIGRSTLYRKLGELGIDNAAA